MNFRVDFKKIENGRIIRLAGERVDSRNEKWTLSETVIIQMIKNGETFYVYSSKVDTFTSVKEQKSLQQGSYLLTEADRTHANNLSMLPECPW